MVHKDEPRRRICRGCGWLSGRREVLRDRSNRGGGVVRHVVRVQEASSYNSISACELRSSFRSRDEMQYVPGRLSFRIVDSRPQSHERMQIPSQKRDVPSPPEYAVSMRLGFDLGPTSSLRPRCHNAGLIESGICGIARGSL